MKAKPFLTGPRQLLWNAVKSLSLPHTANKVKF